MSRAYPFGGVFVMRERAPQPAEPPVSKPGSAAIAAPPFFVDPGTVATAQGAFHWESALEVTADVWFSSAHFDVLEARVAHAYDDGTVVHRRRIIRIGADCWLITDDVAPATVRYELQLQCEASVSATRLRDETLRLSRPLTPDVLVHVAGPDVSPWEITETWVPTLPSHSTGRAPTRAARPGRAVGCAVGEPGGRSAMLICRESTARVELETIPAEGGECIMLRGAQSAAVLIKAPEADEVRSEVGSTDADLLWIAADGLLAIRGTHAELESGEAIVLGGPEAWTSRAFGAPEDESPTSGPLNKPEWKG